jgi:hypothetical protein
MTEIPRDPRDPRDPFNPFNPLGLAPGSVVRLRSGGPALTVTRIDFDPRGGPGRVADVVWAFGSTLGSAQALPVELLEAVQPDPDVPLEPDALPETPGASFERAKTAVWKVVSNLGIGTEAGLAAVVHAVASALGVPIGRAPVGADIQELADHLTAKPHPFEPARCGRCGRARDHVCHQTG